MKPSGGLSPGGTRRRAPDTCEQGVEAGRGRRPEYCCTAMNNEIRLEATFVLAAAEHRKSNAVIASKVEHFATFRLMGDQNDRRLIPPRQD